jgi:hypothetical protein
MLKLSSFGYFILLLSMSLFPTIALSHAGSHGNDECSLMIGDTSIRLNGYQFKGKFPDKHYCRHYPHLGDTIIKVDSTKSDLSGMTVELQLLKRQSWLGLMLQKEDAFTVIKQRPLQAFSDQVVSISTELKEIDIYAIRLKLQTTNGKVYDQKFLFIAGLPFAQIMVGIALILLLFISFIFLKQVKQAL